MGFCVNNVLIAIVLLLPSVTFAAVASQNCGITPGQPLAGTIGKGSMRGDYRNPQHYQPGNLVEQAHFKAEDEQTRSDHSVANLSYTLNRYPNHHRALYAMMRNLEAGYTKKSTYSMECWFRRALYLAPDDAMVYMLRGMYYQQNSEPEKSREEYLKALKLMPNDPQINYNLGLLYFEMDDYNSAAKHAEVAYRHGHPLEGLRKKLQQVDLTVTEEPVTDSTEN